MSEDYSVRQPVMMWNRARGVWETTQVSLLCGHLEPFLESWPISGMTRNGQVFERPMREHRMDVSESLLLRTPVADETGGGPLHPETAKERGQTLRLTGQILAHTGHLLPTPAANLGVNGGPQHPEKRRAGGHSVSIEDWAHGMTAARLLPTPTAADENSSGDSNPSNMTLTDAVVRTQLGATTNPRFDGGKPSQAA